MVNSVYISSDLVTWKYVMKPSPFFPSIDMNVYTLNNVLFVAGGSDPNNTDND